MKFNKFHVTQAKTFFEHQKRIWNELKSTKLSNRIPFYSRSQDWKIEVSHNSQVRKGLIVDFDRERPAD